MYHYGNLFCQTTLQHAAAWVLTVLVDERLNGLAVERGEYLDVLLGFLVAHVEPELVEGVRRGAVAVKPDVAALGLAKLLAVGLGDKRTGEAVGFGLRAQGATYELGACGHVAPLVVTAELELHSVSLVEVEEVVALEQLVGELGE